MKYIMFVLVLGLMACNPSKTYTVLRTFVSDTCVPLDINQVPEEYRERWDFWEGIDTLVIHNADSQSKEYRGAGTKHYYSINEYYSVAKGCLLMENASVDIVLLGKTISATMTVQYRPSCQRRACFQEWRIEGMR